jgi:uncharacterized protein YndB with AHSA1/START domain
MNETIITKLPDQKQLKVTRNFNAPVDLVWKAWTDPELLDKWWAPKPWKTVTKSMDFRPGGRWLYSMNGPAGEQHWSKADFLKIKSHSMYEARDSFCDQEGNENSNIPSMHWNVQFSQTGSGTRVDVLISFPTVEALEKIIEMGFKEGFAAAHNNLDELLEGMPAGLDT